MHKYILKRTLAVIPLLLAISVFTFIFINLIPVDPAEVILRVWNIPVASEELIEATRESMGLNDPYIVRYFNWLVDAMHLDFGISYATPELTVMDKMTVAMPNTLNLASLSFVFVIMISLPIGFLCAVYKDTWFDKLTRGFVFLTTAMPAYWIGLVLMWVVAVKLKWLPTSGNFEGFKSLILPAITVASSYISIFIRLIRNNMIENMSQDYVHYANVRGLKQSSILVKHILKNSLHTCVVAIGMSIPQLIAGTIVVENVFAWPGLGTLCITSVFSRDMPVIQAYVLLVGVLFVVFNLLFDILQGIMDPKMRVGGA
ncbi:MAG: nickel/cobalt ABC transporter permease [Eubacteriales bacterium]